MIRKYLKILLLLLAVAALLTGCMATSQIPTPPRANYPVDMERRYDMPFEAAWERVMRFGQQEGMKVIASDKGSGMMTFARSASSGKLYYNMLLRENTAGNGTVVYVFQRRSQGGAGSAYDTAILNRLSNALAK